MRTELERIDLQYKVAMTLLYIIRAIIMNVSITSVIYSFKHSDKTETQVFLHIPKSFIYNFN